MTFTIFQSKLCEFIIINLSVGIRLGDSVSFHPLGLAWVYGLYGRATNLSFIILVHLELFEYRVLLALCWLVEIIPYPAGHRSSVLIPKVKLVFTQPWCPL